MEYSPQSRENEKMLISELARQAEISVDTIRFYEKQGLLSGTFTINPTNAYKDYSPAALAKLQLIARGKLCGFTLREIGQWTDEWYMLPPAERREVFEAKIRQIDVRIAEQEKMKEYLAEKLTRIPDSERE